MPAPPGRGRRRGPTVGELLKGLWSAETYSLRGSLLKFAVVILVVTTVAAATGATRNGIVGGMAAFVVLSSLAVGAQWVAERRGTPERERRRREEWRAEVSSWPGWKRRAFFTFAAVVGVGLLVVRIASDFF